MPVKGVRLFSEEEGLLVSSLTKAPNMITMKTSKPAM
jgi:hypothetical protein